MKINKINIKVLSVVILFILLTNLSIGQIVKPVPQNFIREGVVESVSPTTVNAGNTAGFVNSIKLETTGIVELQISSSVDWITASEVIEDGGLAVNQPAMSKYKFTQRISDPSFEGFEEGNEEDNSENSSIITSVYVSISVKVNNGAYRTGYVYINGFTVTVNQAGCTTPTITSTLPGSVCGSGAITLSATASAGTIEWYSASTGGSLLNTGSSFTTPSSSSTAVYYVSANNNGCLSTSRTAVVATVNPLPAVYTVTGGGSTCSNGTGVVIGLSGSQSGVSYQLKLSGSNVGTAVSGTGSAISFGSNMVAGTYTVVATSSAGCSVAMGGSATITVLPIPTPAITVADNSGYMPNDGRICCGESVTLTASGGSSYAWSPSTGLSSINTATTVATPNTSTTYKLTVANSYGCTATMSKTIAVYPLPSADFTITDNSGGTPNDGIICRGSSAMLTASEIFFKNSYEWSNDNVILSNESDVEVSPTSTTTYTLTVSSLSGCSASATHTVIVRLPAAAISVVDNSGTSLNDGVICIGSSATLTASGGTSYLWSTNAGLSSTNTATTVATPSANTAYSVTVFDADGCSGTASRTITVNPLPTVSIVADRTTVTCTNPSATLTASGGNSYLWSNGVNAPSITVSPTASTAYNVTATNTSGCSAGASQTVTVDKKVWVGIVFSDPTGGSLYSRTNSSMNGTEVSQSSSTSSSMDGAVMQIFEPEEVDTILTCANRSLTLYSWFRHGGVASYYWSTNATTPTILVKPNETTTYTLTATGLNGCVESASRIIAVNRPAPESYNQNFCSWQNPTVSNLRSTPPDYCTTKWYSTPTGGTSWNSSDALISGTYFAQSELGSCISSSRTPISVYVDPDCSSANYTGSNSLPKNWTETIVYNGSGAKVGHSKSYFDWLGRGIQSQSSAITSGKTVISQVVYDDLGRQVITTLPAAVVNPTLDFKPSFLTNDAGNDYTPSCFDGSKLFSPDKINHSISNGLGWYYSQNNIYESNVPKCPYPYSRVEFSNITGEARRSAGPGEGHYMGSNHVTYGFSMPAVIEELGSFVSNLSSFPTTGLTKSISVDAEGKQVVAFADAQGNVIATGRVGGGVPTLVNGILPKSTGYLDVHIMEGCGNTLLVPSGCSSVATNLLTEQPASSIDLGFYRLEASASTDLSIGYKVNYSDLSFNVYDKAGRLKESYSPKAVAMNNPALKTTYKYNTLGWLLETTDYEQGKSEFVYRKDGSIRFSQNAKQRENTSNSIFSYTSYDASNRPIESGEYRGTIAFSQTLDPETPLPAADCYDKTSTMFDLPNEGLSAVISGYKQAFTDGRVSKTWNDKTTTWYSYTYEGRIEWVVRRIESIGKVVTVNYAYDFNGNVTQVVYQKENYTERFDHIYTYDADLRLSEVSTKTYSSSGVATTTPQAKYIYYAHGPLKRVEYGGNLQGVDYTYTETGALKAINDPLLSFDDPGKDGYAGTNSAFGKDLFGMALDYYSGDYNRPGVNFGSVTGNNRYDGMITSQRWRTRHSTVTPASESQSWLYSYTYDNRNYLSAANFGTYDRSNGAVATANPFSEKGMTYDANGNLQALARFRNVADAMDNIAYSYTNQLKPNQLSGVTDGSSDNTVGSLPSGSTTFTYNAIGQMVSKTESGATEYYKYNPYGLTEGIYTDEALATPKVQFSYDDNGFRVWKKDYSSTEKTETYYVRDASGNILAIYEKRGTALLTQFELPVYGSGKIGTMTRGALHTTYELTDHLGNVRAIFGKAADNTVRLEGYTDYYPYGMVIPSRQYMLGDRYRFGYQGQYAEKDEETGLDHFEARDYDSRIGRWLNFDPAGQYWSPYLGMGNNPASEVDPDGRYSKRMAEFAMWLFGADRIELAGGSKNNWGIVWKGGASDGSNAYRFKGLAPRGFAKGGSTGGSSFGWMQPTTPNPWQMTMNGLTNEIAKKVLQTFEALLMAEGIAELAVEGVIALTEKFAAKTGTASVDELMVMMNKRVGVTAERATGDALEYLNAVDARASHMLMEDGTSSILLRPDATRWDAMHEWLHRCLQVSKGGMTPGEDALIENFLTRHQNYLRIQP